MNLFHEKFSQFAKATSKFTGHAVTFAIALLLIIVWGVTGPVFHYSDTWQLVINTSTTIVTFLMVFLIQNTQNRDSAAVQIKLDELIRALGGAKNSMLDLEEMEEKDLVALKERYEKLAAKARKEIKGVKHEEDDLEEEIEEIEDEQDKVKSANGKAGTKKRAAKKAAK